MAIEQRLLLVDSGCYLSCPLLTRCFMRGVPVVWSAWSTNNRHKVLQPASAALEVAEFACETHLRTALEQCLTECLGASQ